MKTILTERRIATAGLVALILLCLFPATDWTYYDDSIHHFLVLNSGHEWIGSLGGYPKRATVAIERQLLEMFEISAVTAAIIGVRRMGK